MELLPAIEMDSPNGAAVTASIIWLHGLGADGGDFAPLVPQLSLPDRLGNTFHFSPCAIYPGIYQQWLRNACLVRYQGDGYRQARR